MNGIESNESKHIAIEKYIIMFVNIDRPNFNIINTANLDLPFLLLYIISIILVCQII